MLSQATILFIGDSITDAGRARADLNPNSIWALGCGYASMAAARLLSDRPGAGLKFLNRGISGNSTLDLQSRFDADALALRPDILSILIGVNDVWSAYKPGRGGVPADRFEQAYRDILQRTRAQLPDVRLMLGEPFMLPCGEVQPAWRDQIATRQAIVHTLADKFDAAIIPLAAVLENALAEAPATHWAPDGVHPSPAGHWHMAQAWLAVFNTLLPAAP